jgi:ribosomal-protein-alanine N-acetyltransferase
MIIRNARQADRRQIDRLVRFGTHVHRHFDWSAPVELITKQPFVIAEWKYKLVAALACPPEPDGVAWIRLFTAEQQVSTADAWSKLWPMATTQLNTTDLVVAAIAIQDWFQEILSNEQFKKIVDVVLLQWNQQSLPHRLKDPPFRIRRMRSGDLPEVYKVDDLAFELIWKNSQNILEIAYKKSAVATVAENESGIIGYQISTIGSKNGHLARLGVLPEWQGVGVGFSLVQNLLEQFRNWGTLRVTVNTQANNVPSLALYRKLGFQHVDEVYPVFQKSIQSG